MRSVVKSIAGPVRDFFNPRFEALESRLIELQRSVDLLATSEEGATRAEPGGPVLRSVVRQARLLEQVDVSEHNREGKIPRFGCQDSQACSSAQCDDPAYRRWLGLLLNLPEPVPALQIYNRKVWEWAYIAEAVTQAGLMEPGRRALGFGVGNEPLPALLASRGLDVLATDQGAASGEHWAATGELLSGLTGLSRPHLIDADALAARVQVRNVDMNDVPNDLGAFDAIWSSCVIEHLGSPDRGLQFVLESCRMLTPGGVAIHTTELELTSRETTADYGNCAVYRIADLQKFAGRLADLGCSATFNFTVPMDTREDRWISLAAVESDLPLPDIAHLKLALGDSVSTSYGLRIQRDL